MDEAMPTEHEQQAARDDLLRRLDAFAASHDLRDPSLLKLFAAYMRDTEHYFGPARSR
jgi:hypothetical protein